MRGFCLIAKIMLELCEFSFGLDESEFVSKLPFLFLKSQSTLRLQALFRKGAKNAMFFECVSPLRRLVEPLNFLCAAFESS